MSKFYFSFDVGGTDIKCGIIDHSGIVICKNKVSTKEATKNCSLGEAVVLLAQKIASENKFKFSNASGIGIALPGLVDTKNGILKYACNLNIKDYPIVEDIKKYSNLPVKIANDGDLCALAELKSGVGKEYNSFVMIAVGTGIGAGIVIDKKLISNNFSGEIGHMKLTSKDSPKCQCGEYGCFETLASTRALITLTKNAMLKNPKSKMWSKYTPETVTGKTVFEFQNDATAKNVLKEYISNLGDGIVNIVNMLTPEVIILSGAISNQKENLIAPLEEYVNAHIFARHADFKIKIIPASKTSDAGIIGARYLF